MENALRSQVNLDLMPNSPSISKQAQGDLRGASVYWKILKISAKHTMLTSW